MLVHPCASSIWSGLLNLQLGEYLLILLNSCFEAGGNSRNNYSRYLCAPSQLADALTSIATGSSLGPLEVRCRAGTQLALDSSQ